jgi:hypothetical protein
MRATEAGIARLWPFDFCVRIRAVGEPYKWTRWASSRAWLATAVGFLAGVCVFQIIPHWWFGLPAAIVVCFLVDNAVHAIWGIIRDFTEH